MRLEWLEDLLAVLETKSLHAAAARRFVTQPAFSRRLQAIEDQLGVHLIDRSRKPARPAPALTSASDRIRELARGVRDLERDLRRGGCLREEEFTIASQHAISATFAPQLVKRIEAYVPGGVLLRSANLDECDAMLILREVQLTLTYRFASEGNEPRRSAQERLLLGTERFVPVIACDALSMLHDAREIGELPIVAYPPDVFLGRVFEREIFPGIVGRPTIRRKAETSLTLAALQMARIGVGVAWVPTSIAAPDIRSCGLVDLSDELPGCQLEIVATRLVHAYTPAEQAVWHAMAGCLIPSDL